MFSVASVTGTCVRTESICTDCLSTARVRARRLSPNIYTVTGVVRVWIFITGITGTYEIPVLPSPVEPVLQVNMKLSEIRISSSAPSKETVKITFLDSHQIMNLRS